MKTKFGPDYPKIAVASLIQRASDLVTACRRDEKELRMAGLDWKYVEMLGGSIAKCADKEAEYQYQKDKNTEETALLAEYVRSCEMLRRDVAEAARIAFSLAKAEVPLPRIRGARSRIDLVQDLSDIAVFCRIHEEPLKKGRFNFSLVDKAARTAKELSDRLAEAAFQKSTPSTLLEERNRICRKMHEAAVEICRIGRKVFRHDRFMKKAYISIKKS
jgi:hypothetical protein